MRLIGLAVVLAVSLVFAPLAAEAQQAGRIHRIGWLNQGPAPTTTGLVAFREGLKEFGYSEGRHYVIEIRFASGRTELLPGLARGLAALPVDVLIVNSTPPLWPQGKP
jgi:putative tryptophan/tyrosine transport system substrate-binding protein